MCNRKLVTLEDILTFLKSNDIDTNNVLFSISDGDKLIPMHLDQMTLNTKHICSLETPTTTETKYEIIFEVEETRYVTAMVKDYEKTITTTRATGTTIVDNEDDDVWPGDEHIITPDQC